MRAQETTLSNGLRVVYLHHPAVTTINMQLDVAVGAIARPRW
jgi:predicted Zn-dependent peptidase